MSNEEKKKMFEFLDDLREFGGVNMAGAARDLRDEFGLTKAESREVHSEWCRTFAERHPL